MDAERHSSKDANNTFASNRRPVTTTLAARTFFCIEDELTEAALDVNICPRIMFLLRCYQNELNDLTEVRGCGWSG